MMDLGKIRERYEWGVELKEQEVAALFEEIDRLNEEIREMDVDFFATFEEMVRRGKRLGAHGEDMGP